MGKEWKTEKAGDGTEIFNLYFNNNYCQPKVLATLWRGGVSGNWLYTCPLTNAVCETIYSHGTNEYVVKSVVEATVFNYYEGKRDYYQGILDEFEGK